MNRNSLMLLAVVVSTLVAANSRAADAPQTTSPVATPSATSATATNAAKPAATSTPDASKAGTVTNVAPKSLATSAAIQPATTPPATSKPAASTGPSKISRSPHTTKPANPAAVDSLGLLEHAVARDSSKWENLYRLGLMYLDRDRPQEALRVFTKASKVKPNHVPTLVNLGASYDALGVPKYAQETYRRALQIAPGDTVATCRLASSLYAMSQYGEAMSLLRDLIAKTPRAYCAYFTLGVAFADAGIYKDAIRAWQKVVDIAPDSPEAMSAKESIGVLERVVQMKSTP